MPRTETEQNEKVKLEVDQKVYKKSWVFSPLNLAGSYQNFKSGSSTLFLLYSKSMAFWEREQKCIPHMPVCLVIGEASISTCWTGKNSLIFKAISRLAKCIPLHSHEVRTHWRQACKDKERNTV